MVKKIKSYISNYFNKGHERSVLAENIAGFFVILFFIFCETLSKLSFFEIQILKS